VKVARFGGFLLIAASVAAGVHSTDASQRCRADEIVSVQMRGEGEQVSTIAHRVLFFSQGSEQLTVFEWHPTDRIRICRTNIKGLYAVRDLDASAGDASETAHARLVSGPKP